MTKTLAQTELTSILAPINAQGTTPSTQCAFGEFAERVYLPFYGRKWKRSTILTNEDGVKRHSFSVVAHLRFDLRQLFRLAVAGRVTVHPPRE
jgi:hypothetical protein